MKERVDKFLEVMRAKYHENPPAWERMYERLIDNIVTEKSNKQLRKYLMDAWRAHMAEVYAVKWDEDFSELVLKGKSNMNPRGMVRPVISTLDPAWGAFVASVDTPEGRTLAERIMDNDEEARK